MNDFKCYLCGNKKYFLREGTVRDAPELTIQECKSCGLVTLSSIQHISDEHYENSGMHGDEISSIELWLRESSEDDERRIEMLKALLINSNVLDFGCGAAGFVIKAEPIVASIDGVEVEQRVREYWDDKINIIADLDDVTKTYDLITAFHVIEHLPDPISMLMKLADKLSKGGRLVIEVPNSQDALLTLYECNAFQRFTYWSKHLYLFNSYTLERIAKQAGLRVLSVQQYQRYNLSNHQYWLSKGLPGGHKHWSFLDSKELSDSYASSLSAIGKCDTLIAYLEHE